MEMGEVIDWSLALVPVLMLTAVFIWLDVFKLVSLWETVGLLLLGGAAAIAAYPVSGVFLDTLPIGFSTYSRFAAPWIEEALKAIFIMHGTTGAIMAVVAHRLATRELHRDAKDFHFRLWWFVPGYLIAVAIHTAFNQFPSQPMLAMLITALLAPLALLAILRLGTSGARAWLAEEEDAHRALLQTLEAGAFPDKPGWRRVDEMVERAGPQTGALIREYVSVLTRLILAEEEALLRQSEESERIETDGAALFERFKELRQSLGPATIHALTSLLPFSRSDYWEVWELHHHLKHELGGAHRI